MTAKIVCSVCCHGPLDGLALFRNKGALFYNGKSISGSGPLFCARHAPKNIKLAILTRVKIDPETRRLAQ